MTSHTAQKLYFKLDKMNNRKLQKVNNSFLSDPSKWIFEFSELCRLLIDVYFWLSGSGKSNLLPFKKELK